MKAETNKGVKPQYSEDFLRLINDDQKLKELTEGGLSFIEPWDRKEAWENWVKDRRIIVDAISHDGTLLDYGSANGFLLKCLQEWSRHRIDPYGVDSDPRAIEAARKLFSDMEGHFVELGDPAAIKKEKKYPRIFDFVYWSVGDNYTFENSEELPKQLHYVTSLKTLVKQDGRLVLGFYDKKEQNAERLKRLEELGFAFSGVIDNPDTKVVIAYIDVKD